MSTVILGANGRLFLAGGRLLSEVRGAASAPPPPPSDTTGIALVDWYMVPSNGTVTRFNIQTTAASNDTTAHVPIIFNYTGNAPAMVQARVIDGAGADVVPWTDITSSVQVNAGAGLGYLPGVPAGVDYRREVRVDTSATVKATDTVRFNVGDNGLDWGQSNMRGTLEGNKTRDDAVPGTALTELTYYNGNGTAAFFGDSGFVHGGYNDVIVGSYNLVYGGALARLRLVGTALQNKFGRKVGVGLHPLAINGAPLSTFMDSAGNIAVLNATGTAAGQVGFSSPPRFITGDYRTVALHQGESEPSAITRAQRLADLKLFCQAHIAEVAKFGRPANKLTFLFALMGVGSPPQMEVLRGAVLDLVAYGATQGWDVRVGWNCIDLDPQNSGDTLHFGGLDMTRSLYRLIQAEMHVRNPVAVPYGAEGPKLTGAVSRTGDNVTLTVAHEGGTGLSAKAPGSPITGWYANTAADFSGTDIALSNVTIVDSTHVRVTATGAPTTFYIKHCGGKYYTTQSRSPDVSNLIYDNFAYPTGANPAEQFIGLPLNPTPDAIKVG